MSSPRHLPHPWAFVCVLLVSICVTASGLSARTPDARERGVLDFIGGLESNGYDDYARAAAAGPPKPLTTMTVAEVLAWQDSIDAASRSEAAGRYQIMEDTLRGLVRDGAVAPGAVFDATTQDALALELLNRRGWDPARRDHIAMGDAIAHEWAALPICSGLRKGRSAYDGIAGNRSRTSCEAWLDVLANGDDPGTVAQALALSRRIAAERDALSPSALDRFIRETRETFLDLGDRLVPVTTALLFSLLLIEWVWTTAQQVSQGVGTHTLLWTLASRVALACVFLVLISLGNYSDLVIRSAEALLGVATSNATINLLDLFDRILVLVFELFGRSWYNIADKFAAVVILIVGAALIGLILVAYIEAYIGFAAAIVALGFAGWSGTRRIAVRYLKAAATRVLSLLTALFCGALVSALVTLDPTESGSSLLLAAIMVILGLVMITVPAAMEQAVNGYAAPSASGKLAGLINRNAFNATLRLARVRK